MTRISLSFLGFKHSNFDTCMYRIFVNRKKEREGCQHGHNKRRDELFLYKSFHCLACTFAFKFLISKAIENPKEPHLKIFLAHIPSQVCNTFHKHWLNSSVVYILFVYLVWQHKQEAQGRCGRDLPAAFFSINLGLLSKANLPSAIKGIGDCGEFWEFSTELSCLPSSSVHGILQARILVWAAIAFSRGSSQPRDLTQVACIAGRFFTFWATREVLLVPEGLVNNFLTLRRQRWTFIIL